MMPAHRKFLFSFLIAGAIFLFFPRVVLGATFVFSGAPLTINEATSFSVDVTIEGLTAGNKYYLRAAFSHPDTPTSYFGYTKNNLGVWYNGRPSPIDHTQFFQIIMKPDKTWSGSLEVKPDPESSAYQGEGIYNFKIGRYTEAGSGPTWTDNTGQITITAVVTPSPTPTPTPTPTSFPSTAIYKINEVKDKNGNILSSVKIYLDGVYLHHYAPEILTFADGRRCDTYVDCGFGSHTVKLEKSGYDDWSETITVNSGFYKEVNPVMNSSDSFFTPTSTPNPSPTLKPVEISTTLEGEILGEKEATLGAFYPLEATEEAEKIQEAMPSKRRFFPLVLLGLGLAFLAAAAFWVWYNFVSEKD